MCGVAALVCTRHAGKPALPPQAAPFLRVQAFAGWMEGLLAQHLV